MYGGLTMEFTAFRLIFILLQADLRLCFHLQVTAQPAGLFQRRASHGAYRLQDSLGHILFMQTSKLLNYQKEITEAVSGNINIQDCKKCVFL